MDQTPAEKEPLGTIYLPRMIGRYAAGTPVTIVGLLKFRGKAAYVDLRTPSGKVLEKVPIDQISAP